MTNEGAKVPTTLDEIRATVQARYGATAARVAAGEARGASCCGPADESSGCCGSTSESWDPITWDLYEAGETAGLPAEALLASLGCGNPTALPSCTKEKWCSTSARAAGSTCCCRRSGLAGRARRTAST